MTGHKKRFCSFGKWTRITNITKTTVSVRNVALENTLPDVSAVKSALHITPKAPQESDQMKKIVNVTQGRRKCDIITVTRALSERKMGSVYGAANLCRHTARVSARIAELRTRGTMNAVKAVYHALSVRCMASVIGAGKTQ